MSGLNKAMLIGRVGRDAELRYTSGGSPVLSINLATSEVWRDKQGKKQERTEWHRISYWGKGAEAVGPYVLKGKEIYVEGSIQTREWTDRQGQKRYSTEIRADKITLLGGKGGAANGGRRQARDAEAAGPIDAGGFDDSQGFGDELGGDDAFAEPAGVAAVGELTDDEIPF